MIRHILELLSSPVLLRVLPVFRGGGP